MEKRKKTQISEKLKTCVWDTYIGKDIPKHKCFCCKKNMIQLREFHVGHIISDKDGGVPEITNLRPICAPCNLSMGSRNMLEYITNHNYLY